MQTKLNLPIIIENEADYWRMVNYSKDKTTTKQRSTLILKAFIKHDKTKQPIK